jgi:integrase
MAVDDLWYLRRRDQATGERLPSRRHGRGMRWRVRYADDAGERVERLFARKSDADRFDAEARSDVSRGTYIDPALGRRTVKEYGEQWRESLAHNRDVSGEKLELTLRLHVYPRLGGRRLMDVRRSTVLEWIKGLDHLSPRTVHAVYGCAVQLFRAAALDRAIPSSPCVEIKLPAIPKDDRRIPTRAEVHALAKHFDPRFSSAIYVGAGCGLRRGEMAGLEVEHVDFLRREITVCQQVVPMRGRGYVLGPPKTEASYRTVEMPKVTALALARHVELHPPREIEVLDRTQPGEPQTRTARMLFPSATGRLLSRSIWGHYWAKAAKDSGMPTGAGAFHLLRHYFATSLIYGGANVKTVQLALGHSKPSITLDTYVGYWPEETSDRTRHLVDAAMGEEPFLPAANGGASC